MLYKGFNVETRQLPSGSWVARIERAGGGRFIVDGLVSPYLDTIESSTSDGALQLAQIAIDLKRVRL
jgi:hypothetical protein